MHVMVGLFMALCVMCGCAHDVYAGTEQTDNSGTTVYHEDREHKRNILRTRQTHLTLKKKDKKTPSPEVTRSKQSPRDIQVANECAQKQVERIKQMDSAIKAARAGMKLEYGRIQDAFEKLGKKAQWTDEEKQSFESVMQEFAWLEDKVGTFVAEYNQLVHARVFKSVEKGNSQSPQTSNTRNAFCAHVSAHRAPVLTAAVLVSTLCAGYAYKYIHQQEKSDEQNAVRKRRKNARLAQAKE